MNQNQSKTAPFPRFERPSQAVVFWSLENLCADRQGACELSLRELSRHCGLSLNTTHRGVRDLVRLGVIRYAPGKNQIQPSQFELSTGGSAKLRESASAVAKLGVPTPSDNDHDTNRDIYLDDNDRGIVHSKKRHSDPKVQDRLAERIAADLGDTKNLALYQSYCRRYPAPVILKAYIRAKEAPPEKIRKSRGALFNFLVKLYVKRSDN